MRLAAALLVSAVALSGCGLVYRIDVQQGNYVPEDVAAKVQVGMTKPQVRALVGTPLLNDVFHANRWDYFFSSVKGSKAEDRTRFSIFFENDKVVRVEGKARPALPPPVAAPATPASATAPGAAEAKPPAASSPAGSANSPVTPPAAPTPTSPPKQ